MKHGLTRLALVLCVGAHVFTGSGCTTRYDIQVDAIARFQPGAEAYTSYRIRPPASASARAKDRAEFQRTAECIKTALSGHGLYEAPVGTEPDLMVEIDYGIDAPRVKQEKSVTPIYSQQAESRLPMGTALQETTGDRQNSRAGSVQPPTREIVGYHEETRHVVVREKYLSVTGREIRPRAEGRPAVEVFTVRVSAENESSDLEAHIPILASALMEKIGQTTRGIVGVSLAANDNAIAFIKRGN